MGSKARFAKEILPIILKNRKQDQWYIEPFVGGANTIDKVIGKRIGNDINCHIISMYKAIQFGWEPPDYISEEEYNFLRITQCNDFHQRVGFAGIGCSYSGKWFGGYARGNDKNGNPRNYCLESKKNLLNQRDGLFGIQFTCGNYWELSIPDNSIIYCDPPYSGTTKYRNSFDHDRFWQWCDSMKNKGHSIFVSEYNAPEGWQCVWQKEVFNSLTKNTGAKRGIERLFTK